MSRTLQRGMSGPDVRDVQAALNFHLPLPSDQLPVTGDGAGIFGPRTEAKLREFQRRNRLNPDGIVGRLTRPLLFAAHKIDANVTITPKQPVPPVVSPPVVPGKNPVPPFKPPQAPKLHLDNIQIQPGGQHTFSDMPVVHSAVLAVSGTFLTQHDGTHLELQLGIQGFFNSRQSDSRYDLQAFGQVNLANLIETDRFNLSIFGQVSALKSLSRPTSPNIGIAAGAQANFVIIKDSLMLTWQVSPTVNLDLGSGKLSAGFQSVEAVTVQFAAF